MLFDICQIGRVYVAPQHSPFGPQPAPPKPDEKYPPTNPMTRNHDETVQLSTVKLTRRNQVIIFSQSGNNSGGKMDSYRTYLIAFTLKSLKGPSMLRGRTPL